MSADPAEDRIEAYLGEIAALLTGPRGHRRRIIDELRDGVREAAADHLAAGVPAGHAADAAIEQFGPPEAVAAAFAGELAIGYARRTLILLLCTGPIVGVCWLLALGLTPWRTGMVVLLAVIPALPVVAAAVVLAARTIATTGSLVRWLPETGPGPALTATAVVAVLAILVDLAVAGRYLWTRPGVSVAAALALTASGFRILACLVVLHRLRSWRGRVS
ncbi:permease prefix domain 1-containing protein [Actinoplanes aureus]|uniref:Uncharacterized protein n=1 Tax=Actinoplanes aureus TaxID=2792083 RepID=A0A931FWH9_9ACTN|nr:permease prefix domain 1-containing protein [Actinoplanes aureus]MBG0561360.1 hypothetical protein [Actinoplanes aureus]